MIPLKISSSESSSRLSSSSTIRSKNAGFFSVTVNDSQQDCAMQLLKAAGLPNSGWPSASFSQRAQPPLSALVSFLGALVIEPRLEASVMEPFCKKTKSPSFTAITSLFVPPQATDAGHDELAVFGLVIEVFHLAIRDQTDALGREPRVQGQNQRDRKSTRLNSSHLGI